MSDLSFTASAWRKTVPALMAVDGNGMCLFWLSSYFWPQQVLEALGLLLAKPLTGAWTDEVNVRDIPGRSFGKAARWRSERPDKRSFSE